MAQKCIMILLDGIGDRAFRQLDNRTPLQAAHTPHLDGLAKRGANGLFHAARLGQALPSENAHFAMFGYGQKDFPGRGALEALGAGIPLGKNEVAILAHFVSLTQTADRTLELVDGKPAAEAGEIRELAAAVGEYDAHGVRLTLHPTGGIRAILTLSGEVSPFVTDSDPVIVGRPLSAVVPWQPHAENPRAIRASRALDAYLQWACHRLGDHEINTTRREAGRAPLNGLVTQRAGQLKAVEPFSRWYGLRGLSIASGIVYHGLAAYLGMDWRKDADTDRADEDLARRLKLAMAALDNYDFIHVHTKMPDKAGHMKDPVYKTRIIEMLDRGIGQVAEQMTDDPELLIVVAADHSTPSAGPLIHSGEAVPLLFFGEGVRRDPVHRYDEVSAAGGCLGGVRGKEMMYLVLNHLERAKLQGLMDTPKDQPCWPGQSRPLRLNIDTST